MWVSFPDAVCSTHCVGVLYTLWVCSTQWVCSTHTGVIATQDLSCFVGLYFDNLCMGARLSTGNVGTSFLIHFPFLSHLCTHVLKRLQKAVLLMLIPVITFRHDRVLGIG